MMKIESLGIINLKGPDLRNRHPTTPLKGKPRCKSNFKYPDDGLMQKPKRLTSANNSSINKIIL